MNGRPAAWQLSPPRDMTSVSRTPLILMPSHRMRAIAKTRPGPGLELVEVPVPRAGRQRRADQDPEDRDLRHRRPHLQLGRLGADRPSRLPMVIGHEFVGEIVERRRQRAGLRGRRSRRRRGPHRLRALPQLPRRPPASLHGHQGRGREPRRRLCRIPLHPGQQRLCTCDPRIPLEVLACFDPLGNATHTALSVRPASARTCSSPAPGPSAAWPPRSRATPARARSWSPT